MDKKSFCFDDLQVDRLVQLVKHESIKLGILLQRDCLSDSTLKYLQDEYSLYSSILDVLLNRG